MAEKTYVDLLPNQKKDEAERQRTADRLRQEFDMRLDASIERSWKLPAILVRIEGEYLELLIEARKLYVDGYFYSCVAMCGIVSERRNVIATYFAYSVTVLLQLPNWPRV
jgi:hypothetical protein